MKQTIKGKQQPFFAAFLEAQQNLSAEEQETLQGGQTLKYPSDKEDGLGTGPINDGYQTQKYPSDSDEGV